MEEAARIPQTRDALASFSPYLSGGIVFWLREIPCASQQYEYVFYYDVALKHARDEYDFAHPLVGQKEDRGGYQFCRADENLEPSRNVAA